ncbi:hypothetical protein [Aquibacillus salsiterrae]|nr:hypothetical protein [Aquibacillus salsiterrae]
MEVGNNEILQAIRELNDNMNRKFKQVDAKFEQIDERFEQIDRRFEQIDRRFEQIENRLDNIEHRLGSVEKNTSFLYTEVGKNSLKIKQLSGQAEQ